MRAINPENVKDDQKKRKATSRTELRANDPEKAKDDQRRHKTASIANLRAINPENVKDDQKKHKATSRTHLRANDPEKARDDQRRHKTASIANLRAINPEKVKEDQKNRKRLSMGKKRGEDNKKVKYDQNAWQANCRQVENSKDRLKEFKAATLYNAIFLCTCCHQRMFQSNVQEFNDDLKEKINSRTPGLIQKCIADPLILTTVNGKGKCFICKTCVRHLKMKKMPPMSTENGLKLEETDKQIKDQNLELTELEGALIAKNIIFQKIYQLPKSRWTALKDRVINVPINEDSIINTLEQMPRT